MTLEVIKIGPFKCISCLGVVQVYLIDGGKWLADINIKNNESAFDAFCGWVGYDEMRMRRYEEQT